jgi:Rod binding domain-containing protein
VSSTGLSLPVLSPREIVAQSGSATAKPDNAEAAKQFEAMLMAYVFQQMRQTVPSSGLFGDNGIARSTYEYLFDQAVTTNAMKAGKGWGLSERLEAVWNSKSGKDQGTM